MTIQRDVPHASPQFRFSLAPVALLAAVAMLLTGLCGSASAAKPIAKDGKIHTCYKAKGKAKGSLRVVPAGKKCMKGWRKLAWTAASTTNIGQAGPGGNSGTSSSQSNGASGSNGSSGNNGSNGTDGNGDTAVLETKVATLGLKVEALEKLLDGVTNGDLGGVVKTLNGVSGPDLSQALGTVPVLEDVCTQVSGLTGGLDAVNEGVKGLDILGLPGLSLGGLSLLPNNLPDSYNCPAL